MNSFAFHPDFHAKIFSGGPGRFLPRAIFGGLSPLACRIPCRSLLRSGSEIRARLSSACSDGTFHQQISGRIEAGHRDTWRRRCLRLLRQRAFSRLARCGGRRCGYPRRLAEVRKVLVQVQWPRAGDFEGVCFTYVPRANFVKAASVTLPDISV